jgi:hypothetical protein
MPSRNRKMSRRRFSRKRVNKSVRSKRRTKRTRRTRRRMKGGGNGNEMSNDNIQTSLGKLVTNDFLNDEPNKEWLNQMIQELKILTNLSEKGKKRFDCESDIYTGKSKEACVNYMKQKVAEALRKKMSQEARPNQQAVLFDAKYTPPYIAERNEKPHEMRVQSKLIVPQSQYDIDLNRVNRIVQEAGVIPEDEE